MKSTRISIILSIVLCITFPVFSSSPLCIELDKDTTGLLEIVDATYLTSDNNWSAIVSIRNISEQTIDYAHLTMRIGDPREIAGKQENGPNSYIIGAIFVHHACVGVNECVSSQNDNRKCIQWKQGEAIIVQFLTSAPTPACDNIRYSIILSATFLCFNSKATWGHSDWQASSCSQ
jgi:hypothetical protein